MTTRESRSMLSEALADYAYQCRSQAHAAVAAPKRRALLAKAVWADDLLRQLRVGCALMLPAEDGVGGFQEWLDMAHPPEIVHLIGDINELPGGGDFNELPWGGHPDEEG